MDLKAASRSSVVLVLCTSLSACAAGIAHENCNPPLNLYRFEVEFSMKHIRESSNEAVEV